MPLDQYLPFGKPDIGPEEIQAVTRVMQSGWVGMGNETVTFEQELATFAQAETVVTVNSCTSALFLSLLIEGIGQGDEVIVPTMTWCSSANSAMYLGAKPVFCDVDPDTLCLTPETVMPHVTSKTRAVVVVHYGGLTVDIAALRRALPQRIKIIEDAAHALGSTYANGQSVGSSGALTCFSFYANKNLSTAEGGAIALNDPERGNHLRSLRLHGLPVDAWKRFTHPKVLLRSADLTELGYKLNYTDLQAAIGRVQLRRQGEFAQRRLEVARVYCEGLHNIHPGISWQTGLLDPGHARHLFVIKLPDGIAISRDEFILALREKNVGASIHYAPLHRMPLYGISHQRLPVSEDLYERIVTLPISASMSAEQAYAVLDAVAQVLQDEK
jgi:dTDP-4-amino-4,6-dideoxygalactose transaminase